jgi:hypothetical protein
MYLVPEKVAEGLRDYIAWECRVVAEVTVTANRGGGYIVNVAMEHNKAATRSKKDLERDFADILPAGFTLTMHWL